MKVVARTLIILAAALAVAAAVGAAARTSFGQGLLAAGPGRGEFGREGEPPPGLGERHGPAEGGLPGGARPGGFEGRGHGEHGPSLSGLAEVGKNLAIVAVSVAVVAAGARLLRLRRRA